MFNMRIEGNLQDAIQFVDQLIELQHFIKSARGKELLAEILTDSHQMAFERGGWGWRGDADWIPTDKFWVQHLDGKVGDKPMVWTGNAQQTVHAVPTSRGADVVGPSYLQKFLPGNKHSFTETFSVSGEDEDWVKMSDMDSGDRKMTRRIHVHERELAAVFDKDVEDFIRHAMDEVGIGYA